MAVTVSWEDDEHTVLVLSFADDWTLDEFRDASVQAILMVRSTAEPVYVISDFSQAKSIPLGILWQARDINRLRPANWTAGITISHDWLLKNLLDVFSKVYMGQEQRRVYVVKTEAEAKELIRKLKRDNQVL
ncbi:MAG: hypothetical protein ABI700_05215 [Chloroflexota bacterium]